MPDFLAWHWDFQDEIEGSRFAVPTAGEAACRWAEANDKPGDLCLASHGETAIICVRNVAEGSAVQRFLIRGEMVPSYKSEVIP